MSRVRFVAFPPVFVVVVAFAIAHVVALLNRVSFRGQLRHRDQRGGARPRLPLRREGAEHEGRGQAGHPRQHLRV